MTETGTSTAEAAPPELVGKTGIVMRELTPSDTPDFYEFVEKHRAELEAMGGAFISATSKTSLEMLLFENHEKNITTFGIWLKEMLIGFRETKTLADGKVSTGAVIDRDYRGQGYGPDSLVTLAEQELERGVPAVIAYVSKDNAPSIASVTKTGFLKRGEIDGEILFEMDRNALAAFKAKQAN